MIDLGADLEGEARDVAAAHARLALKARREGKRIAILSGGELTVTVRGNGRGGPNQEYALALADLLKDTPGISALAGDTDGADGGAGSATDPAGAVIDQATFAKMKSLGLDPSGLSRQQRRHRVLCGDRRSAADRPDADQCQRHQGDPGGPRLGFRLIPVGPPCRNNINALLRVFAGIARAIAASQRCNSPAWSLMAPS